MNLTEKEWEVYQLNPERHEALLRWIKVLSESKLRQFQEFRMESGNRLILVYKGVRIYMQSPSGVSTSSRKSPRSILTYTKVR